MRVCFDVQHPAQVHLFRNAISELQADGHETLVLSREKEQTLELLDAYGIDHRPLSVRRPGVAGAAFELGVRELRTLRDVLRFDPDVTVSRMSVPAAHAAALTGATNVAVTDTNLDSAPLGRLLHAVTLPFVDVLCHSPGLEVDAGGARTYDLPFQELAYLHPQRFDPDPGRLAAWGVDVEEPYAVVRLAGWDAYHDVGHAGIDTETLTKLLERLNAAGTVYLSTEGDLPENVDAEPVPTPPHLVHDLLAYANWYVGDSGTMATEAALLGTPAVRTNSMVGDDDEPVFVTLEEEYGLLYSYADSRAAIEKVDTLLADPTATEWEQKRQILLEDATDVAGDLVSIVEAAGAGPGGGQPWTR